MRKTVLLWFGMSIATLAGAQEQGLRPAIDALGGPTLQARFERDLRTLAMLPNLASTSLPGASSQTLRLMGDYQFSTLRLGETGGLRLTGGLLINLRNTGSANPLGDAAGALPYAGVGYASGSQRGEWGFSADLGLAAQGLGPARLERLLGTASSLGNDAPFRLLPMIRLGVNLTF
jgi:hypothetical protein